VVANEIRKLAENSGEQSKTIATARNAMEEQSAGSKQVLESIGNSVGCSLQVGSRSPGL
jgi:methyl-accepting chemotaxis protein